MGAIHSISALIRNDRAPLIQKVICLPSRTLQTRGIEKPHAGKLTQHPSFPGLMEVQRRELSGWNLERSEVFVRNMGLWLVPEASPVEVGVGRVRREAVPELAG